MEINFGKIIGPPGKDGAPGKDGVTPDMSLYATKEELTPIKTDITNLQNELSGVTALANEINGEII